MRAMACSEDPGSSLPVEEAALVLRAANPSDKALLFEWRNLKEIVSKGESNRTVSWAEHSAWFDSHLENDKTRLYIVEVNGVAAGQIRFDSTGKAQATVSVFLLKEYCGRGLGSSLIVRGCQEAFRTTDVDHVKAVIRRDNPRASRAFQAAGFQLHQVNETTEEHLLYRREISVPHNRVYADQAEVDAVTSVIKSGKWVEGEVTQTFEREVAFWYGSQYATAVSSGMSALQVALLALGCKPGDEVIIPAYCCVAIPNALLSLNLTPRVVDVDPKSWNINPTKVKEAVSPKTVCIVAVATFGTPVDIMELEALGLPVIYDVSHGARRQSLSLSPSSLAIASLYATKALTCGAEGGIVFSNSLQLSRCCYSFKTYDGKRSDSRCVNRKFSDGSAAFALCQLKRLEQRLADRETICDWYREESEKFLGKGIVVPSGNKGEGQRVWYRFAVEVSGFPLRKMIHELRRRGIQAESPVDSWLAPDTKMYEHSERAYSTLLSLPLYSGLDRDKVRMIISAIDEVLSND